MPRLPLYLLAFALTLSACDFSVNDGPVGPPGPRGPSGNTEVFVRTFELSEFSRRFSDSDMEVQYQESFPELTEDVVDFGMVMVYAFDAWDEDGLVREGWTPLPQTFGVDIPDSTGAGDGFVDYTLTTTFTVDFDRLYVNLLASDVFTLGELRGSGYIGDLERVTFRLVGIPGDGTARRASVDWSDYEAVRKAYDLPE
jgi:hypothetical protein